MTLWPHRTFGALLWAVVALPVCAQTSLDNLGQRLRLTSADGERWLQLSSHNDLTVYAFDAPAPGLLFTDSSPFLAPRLTLAADAGLGARLRLHARATADRGFDPGTDLDGDLRIDEYYLQLELPDPGRTQLRLGKFATAFGGWVDRHLPWDNPLVTAPALYEDMVTITDQAAPADLAAFIGRRDAAENKPAWVPLVWGPSYASGASVNTGIADLVLTLEVKNAALSSRPDTWDVVDDGFTTDPTYTGRLAWHPDPAWTVAASLSRGPYLRKRADVTLPPGTDVDDFHQTTAGVDATFERRRLQIWAELVRSTFEVPRVGDVEAVSGFVELRIKTAPRVWLAGRWNQSWFDDAPGLDVPWDRHLRRLDVGLGYRHSAHVQAKLEVSVGDQAGRDTNGNVLAAAQLVMWF